MTPSAPPIRWDIVDEHLDEAAFLYGQWERALVDPEYTLGEVLSGPEERLLAHLDGLVVAGQRAAEKLLLPALGGDDPGLVFAAAYALLASEDGDFSEPVLKALVEGEPAAADAVVRALQVTQRGDLYGRLAPLLAKGPAPVQARVLEVLAFLRIDPRVRLDPLARSTDEGLRRAVLRVGRIFPAQVPLQQVELALASKDPAERALALEVGLVQGSKGAWAAVERALAAPVPPPEWAQAALLWALSGERELRPLLSGLTDPKRRNAALFALGFTGRVAAVEAALAWLADEQAGKVAAEAFSAVTGLVIEKRFATPSERWDPDAPEDEEEASDEAEGPEADLPAPAPEAIGAWWQAEQARFDPLQRWLGGKPWAIEGVVAGLEEGPCRRRGAQALDLAIRSRGQLQLETTAPARRQVAELAELRRGLPRGLGTYREIIQAPAPRGVAPRPVEGALLTRVVGSGPPPPLALAVTGLAMATSLGSLVPGAAAAAAGLVRVDEIPEVEVFDEDELVNEPTTGHPVAAADGFVGVARLASLAAEALAPLLAAIRLEAPGRLGLVVALPSGHHLQWAYEESDDQGGGEDDGTSPAPRRDHLEACEGAFLPALAALLPEGPVFAQRAVLMEDAPGFVSALELARQWLAKGLVERCVVGGVDSLVDPAVLGAIAARDLLKGPERPSGLAPGEAAAFVVVEPTDRGRRAGRHPVLSIEAIAADREDADARSAGSFMGAALARALAAVVPKTPGRRLVLGDLDGTTIRAHDWGSALARHGKLLEGAVERHAAQSFGAIGSAAGPVSICLAAEAFRRGMAPGPEAVIWLWSELGSRAALRVRAPEKP